MRRSSSSLTCGSAPRRPRVRVWRGRAVSRRTSSSVSRTLRPWSTTARASRSGSALPIRARAWPADSLPSATAPAAASGSVSGAGCVAAALPDRGGELLLGVAELVDQPAEALGLFQRRQVGPLDVLDQGELKGVLVRQLRTTADTSCSRPAAPRASAARRRRSRNRQRRWRTAAPGAVAGCRARGSRRRARPARPRRTAAGVAAAKAVGTRSGQPGRRRPPAISGA